MARSCRERSLGFYEGPPLRRQGSPLMRERRAGLDGVGTRVEPGPLPGVRLKTMEMHPLLVPNIKRSFKILAEGSLEPVPGELIRVERDPLGAAEPDNSSCAGVMRLLAASRRWPQPWFFRRDAELDSPQAEFFGVFAMRNLLRGPLVSIRFVQAADLLLEQGFLSPSVMCSYTAAFHLAQSFLAAHGRVLVEEARGRPVVRQFGGSASLAFDGQHIPDIVMALLTKANTWKFEGRGRTHTQRWADVQAVLLALLDERVPTAFDTLFCYLTTYGPYGTEDAEARVREGIQRLADVRHAAIYRGYGEDDFAADLAAEGESVPGEAFHYKAEAMRDFAAEFLSLCAEVALGCAREIPKATWDKVWNLLTFSVMTPPFELGLDLRISSRPELTEPLAMLTDLVMSRPETHGD